MDPKLKTQGKPTINVAHRLHQSQLGKINTRYFKAYERTTENVWRAKAQLDRAMEALRRFHETESSRNMSPEVNSGVDEAIIRIHTNEVNKALQVQNFVLERFRNR